VFQEEAERQFRERKEEEERLALEKEALERRADQERMAREEAERRSREAERQARERKREQEEEEERQTREREERKAHAEAERWKAEAERLAREKEALERRADEERSARELGQREKPHRSPAPPQPQPSPAPPPLRLQVLAGSQVQDGTDFLGHPKWRVETRPVEVEGYREELAPGVAITMVRIPAGSFLMGSPEDEPECLPREVPQHEVTLAAFCLGQTPITHSQWKVVAGWDKVERELKADPSWFKGANRPVEQVRWHYAVEFCKRLSASSGKRYGLPSEAQWEYACRAGTTTPFHFGATISPDLANYDGNQTYGQGQKGAYRQQTTEVGSFPANAWGLQDMHGNVWEWCADHWHDSYDGAPKDGSPWLNSTAGADEHRLLRGGSWYYGPRSCRSAFLNRFVPGLVGGNLGFRVVCLPQSRSS
jgi:formylglycine-generating enzyme required for sulfatase activity